MAEAAVQGPANVTLPVCAVCLNKPPSRAVRVVFSCGHTYHMGCHDGKYATTTKTGDKLCAPCCVKPAIGPDSTCPTTPGADIATPPAKLQQKSMDNEAEPAEEKKTSSGPDAGGGGKPAAGSKRKRGAGSGDPAPAQPSKGAGPQPAGEAKPALKERQSEAAQRGAKKTAHKPAAH